MITNMTQQELATISGYSKRHLRDLNTTLPDEKKFLVVCDDGKYDLPLFVQRWVAFNVGRTGEDKSTLDDAKTRHEIIKTQKTELEVQRLRGQLVDVQEVKVLWAKIASDVTQNLINLPKKIAPSLTMMESSEIIASLIDDEIRNILENIADTPLPDYLAETEEEIEDDE